MNARLYRIVFNRARGQLMAVQETAVAQGKTACGHSTQHGRAAAPAAAEHGVMRFVLRGTLWAVIFGMGSAHIALNAQIVADPNATKGQQATVLNTANGLPQVNIQTPSAGGVSRNVFKQFDVQANGAVLNNSRKNTQSQLGGWIEGNPWLTTGTARVIVGEVNSSAPSQLNGYIEVAGDRAQVVIANPAGIACSGCGFINANRATLTTGLPRYDEAGALTGYRVQQGTVTVNGGGLDNRSVDYTELLARAVQLNAGLWAKQLDVVTGANDISTDTLATTATTPAGAAPAVAIDVAQLGGMYAGKITLIGTEAGVGVRNAGALGAQAGDLVVTVDGKLVNSGTIITNAANANLNVTAQALENSGSVSSQQNLNIGTRGIAQNAGLLSAEREINVQAGEIDNRQGAINAKRLELAATALNNAGGKIKQTGSQRLEVDTGSLDNTSKGHVGAIAADATETGEAPQAGEPGSPESVAPTVPPHANADGSVTTSPPASVETGETLATGSVRVSGHIDNTAGLITATGSVDLVARTGLDNSGGRLNLDVLQVAGGDLVNRQGQINASGIVAQAGHIDNTGGKLLSTGAQALQMASLDNTGGLISASGGLNASTTATLVNTAGTIASGADLHLAAGNLVNTNDGDTAGYIGSISGKLHITVGDTLDNQGGILQVGKASSAGLTIGSKILDNRQGTILQTGGGDAAITASATLDNRQGTIFANGANLSLDAARLHNRQGEVLHAGTGTLKLDHATLDNTAGQVATNGGLSAQDGAHTSTMLINDAGMIRARTLNIGTAQLSNRGGALAQTGSAATVIAASTALDNTGGDIASAASSLTLTTPTLTNQGGRIQGLNDLHIDTGSGGRINNRAGLLAGNGLLTLKTGSVDNTETQATDARPLGIQAGNVSVATGEFDNRAGMALASGNLDIAAVSAIHNQRGRLSSNGRLSINDTASPGSVRNLAINNTEGQLGAADTVALSAQTLTGDGTVSAGNTLVADLGGDYTHQTGAKFTAGQAATLKTAGKLVNEGALTSLGNLTLSALHIDNRASGEIGSGGTTTLTATSNISNHGLIDGKTTDLQASTIDNLGTGRIYGDRIAIAASVLNNLNETAEGITKAAVIASRGNLDIGVGTLRNAEDSLIYSTGAMAIAGALDAGRRAQEGSYADAIHNDSATIESGGAMTLAARLINNTNDHVSYELVRSDTGQHVVEFAPEGSTTRHDASVIQIAGRPYLSDGGWKIEPTFGGDTWRGNMGGEVLNLTDGSATAYGARYFYMVLPSEKYPLDRFKEYYAPIQSPQTAPVTGFMRLSSNSVGTSCTGGGDSYECREYSIEGAHYAPDQKIWKDFNVAPPPAEVAYTDGNPCASYSGCKVGDKGYYTNTFEDFRYHPLPRTVTQADVDNHHARQTWLTARDAADLTLDTALSAFYKDLNDRRVANFNIWDYTRTAQTPVLTTSAPAKIVSGGDMDLRLGNGVLNNDMSQVIAGGTLRVNGGASASGQEVAGESDTVQLGGATINNLSRIVDGEVEKFGAHVFTFDKQHNYRRGYIATPMNDKVTYSMTLAGARLEQSSHATEGTVIAARNPGQTVTPTQGAGTVAAIVETPLAPNADGSPGGVIRTTGAHLAIRNNSLYTLAPGNAGHLVETDPRFTNYRQWLSSDYMLSELSLDPATEQKRLGDGFYEQKLIREQVAQLTGRRYLGDFSSDEAQYMALMNNGATFAKAANLRPGIALSAAQVAQLTSDIVWLVEQDITLPDGRTTRALVPQVYVKVRAGDVDASGALLAGKKVDMNLERLHNTGGTVAGRELVRIDATTIDHLGGRLKGDAVALNASEDINVVGASVEADRALLASAGRDLNVISTTRDSTSRNGGTSRSVQDTVIDRVAGLYVSGQAGALRGAGGADADAGTGAGAGASASLSARAGRNLNLNAATVDNLGEHGRTTLSAGDDLNLGTVTTRHSEDTVWNGDHRRTETSSREVGSRISGANLALDAGGDLNARAAQITATTGAADLSAGRDVKLFAGQATSTLDEAHRFTNRGLFSSATTTTRSSSASTTALGSEVSGQTVSITSGTDTRIGGSSVLADERLDIKAGRNLSIEAAQNTQSESSFNETRKSGLFGSGGIGFTIGKQQQSTDAQNTQTTAAASTVGSIGGNVNLNAGQTYTQTGSDVAAPNGDVNISARNVDIQEARETGSSQTEQRFKQSGITVAASAPIVSAAQTLANTAQATATVGSSRMQALGAATAALQAKDIASQAAKIGDALTKGADLTEAANASLNLSLGSTKSQSAQSTQSDTARGSRVTAGGEVNIRASGAGQDSEITIQGSDVKAAGTTRLSAEDEVKLLAAQNTSSERNSQSSQSGSVGVSISTAGVSATASASRGKGQGAGEATTYTNAQVSGKTVQIESGGDTTLKGAVVEGERVTAAVGGRLNIESLQDRSRYKESSQNAGFSVSVPIPGTGQASASVNAGKTQIDSNYNSVTEQSAIHAGDGGFQIAVKGDTILTGGQITSTQAAIDKNRFEPGGTVTTTDLHNSARYEAQSLSVGVGTGTPKPGASPSAGLSGMGIGSDSGSASTTTTAAISGLAGNTAARTGDAETGIKPIFNKDEVKQEVNAQIAITQEAGKRMPKFIADEMGQKSTTLETQAREAERAGDADKAQALRAEAQKYDEGGIYRIAAHTALGALAGGVNGALGAAASSAAAPTLNDIQIQLQSALQNAGMGAEASQQVASLSTGALAATLGATAGGTAGAATAFNADMNNRQLHPTEKAIIRNELAKRMAKDKGISEAQAVARLDAQLLRQIDATAVSAGGSDADAATYINSYKASHAGQSVGKDQWGNSVPLFGAVGYQRQDSTIFSANPQSTNKPANLGLSQVGDHLSGVASGFVSGAKNMANALLHPIDTVNNLVEAVANPVSTGAKIQQKAGQAIDAAQSGNMKPVGELLGEDLGASVTGTLVGAGVAKAVTMAKAANTATAAAKAEAQAVGKARMENNFNAENAKDPFNIQSPENTTASQHLLNKAASDQATGTYNPHYDSKHGPATTLAQQYDRAMNGANPQTGGIGMPADASKFFNAADMETAIKQAEAAYAANPAKYVDPRTGNVNIDIPFNRPVGEGYMGNTRRNRSAGVPVGEYRWSNTASVGIDPTTGKAYTAYPNVTQGTAKPDPLTNGVQR